MEKTLINNLNKILTNTLEYQEVLNVLAKKISAEDMKKKLIQQATVKKKQAEKFIKLISSIGGDVQSTQRITDQESVSWIERPIPETDDLETILTLLIKIEQNARKDYQKTIVQKNIDEKIEKELQIQLQESETNLNYYETAKESLLMP